MQIYKIWQKLLDGSERNFYILAIYHIKCRQIDKKYVTLQTEKNF